MFGTIRLDFRVTVLSLCGQKIEEIGLVFMRYENDFEVLMTFFKLFMVNFVVNGKL